MGGEFEGCSEPGEGAQIVVRVPLVQRRRVTTRVGAYPNMR